MKRTTLKKAALAAILIGMAFLAVPQSAEAAAKKYTIKYELNGGVNHKSNPKTYKKTSKTIKLKNPTKKGYTFKGWYTSKKYTKKVTQIKKGSKGNKKFYAKWAVNKYTIKFNGNGATSGSMKSLTNCKYATGYKLTANAYKRSGYTFNGWNTKKDGKGKAYANKASVKKLTSKNKGTVTLYAQWKKNTPKEATYTITYQLNGGTNHKSNPKTYQKTTATITLKNPTKKGYVFKGWYADAGFTKQVTQIKKGSSGNRTLYAKWEKDVAADQTAYKITYIGLDGKEYINNPRNPKTYTAAQTAKGGIPLYEPTSTVTRMYEEPEGWFDCEVTFGRWWLFEDGNSEGVVITEIPKGTTGDITIGAEWGYDDGRRDIYCGADYSVFFMNEKINGVAALKIYPAGNDRYYVHDMYNRKKVYLQWERQPWYCGGGDWYYTDSKGERWKTTADYSKGYYYVDPALCWSGYRKIFRNRETNQTIVMMLYEESQSQEDFLINGYKQYYYVKDRYTRKQVYLTKVMTETDVDDSWDGPWCYVDSEGTEWYDDNVPFGNPVYVDPDLGPDWKGY